MSITLKEHCPSYSTIKFWVSNFKRGSFGVDDEMRVGRPISMTSDENIEKVYEMIVTDRRVGMKNLAESLLNVFWK